MSPDPAEVVENLNIHLSSSQIQISENLSNDSNNHDEAPSPSCAMLHFFKQHLVLNRVADSKDAPNKKEKKKLHEKQRRAMEVELIETVSPFIDDFPLGYPALAAFQASEPSFSIYRSFDYLHSRVILDLQDELRSLEDDLMEIDEDDAYSTNARQKRRVRSRDADIEEGFREATEQNRTDILPSRRIVLLEKIRLKLIQYDEILFKTRELAEFQRPSERDRQNVRRWFWGKKPLSYEVEAEFIKRTADLITLKPRAEWGKFDSWIEDRVPRMPSLFRQCFEAGSRKRTLDKNIEYYSPSKIEKFTTLIIAFVIIILLATPVFLMYRVSWEGGRHGTFLNVGLLILFTLLFSASMSLLTKAKRAELFAASAAYCAVLIVFIGNFSGGGGG